MKTVKTLCLATALAAMLCSCGALLTTTAEKSERIRLGMSMEEVKSVMGKADYRRFDADREQWEYRQWISLTNDYDVVIIDFADGKVASMNAFREVHHHPEPPHAAEKK